MKDKNSSILKFIKPVIIYYAASKVIKNYNLHSDYKPKSISKVTLSPELTIEYSDIDINKIVSSKYKESVLKFVKVLIQNFSKDDLKIFYNNINSLKVKSKSTCIQSFIIKRKIIAGEYDPENNEIIIDDNIIYSTIFHELFHMASTIYKDDIYSGFYQSSLGRGLTEGYTEFLSRRYFPSNSNVVCAYEYLVFISSKLEHIIGKEKMQRLYLNANLKGLIDELKLYTKEEDIMKFISNTDFLVEHMADRNLELFEKNMIGDCLKNINKFLITCYSKKQQLEIKKDNIETILKNIKDYSSSLVSNIEIHNHKYIVMTDKDVKEYIRLSFETNKDIKKI